MEIILWVAFLGLFLIILASIAIGFRNIFVINNSYGQYSIPFILQCSATCLTSSSASQASSSSNNATASGTALSVQRCIPNAQTGYGCLVTDSNGFVTQTYQPIITTVPCSLTCPSASWVTVATRPCQAFSTNSQGEATPIPTEQCYDNANPNLVFTSSITRLCVAGSNPNGPNNCITTSYTQAYPGQTEVVITGCTNPPNPQCGSFLICQGTLPYNLNPATATTKASPFDLFHEGVIVTAQTCTYYDANGMIQTVTPNILGPTSPYCLLNQSPCRTVPSAYQVETKTIPNPTVQNVCTANPSCFHVARKYPVSTNGVSSSLANLLNRPSYLNLASNGYIAPVSQPNHANSGGDGYSTTPIRLSFLPSFSTGQCSPNQIALVSGLVVWFCPDSDSGGPTYTGRLMALINNDYLGWLGKDNSGQAIFLPVQGSYLQITSSGATEVANGSTWLNAAVVTLTINSLVPVTPIPSNLPSGTSGLTVSITGVTVNGLNLNNLSMYLLPAVVNTSLTSPVLDQRTSGNPCNVLPVV